MNGFRRCFDDTVCVKTRETSCMTCEIYTDEIRYKEVSKNAKTRKGRGTEATPGRS